MQVFLLFYAVLGLILAWVAWNSKALERNLTAVGLVFVLWPILAYLVFAAALASI
jgi:hypothetical protein